MKNEKRTANLHLGYGVRRLAAALKAGASSRTPNYALLGVLGVLAVGLFTGCGVMGGGPDEGGISGPTGRAAITITWPQPADLSSEASAKEDAQTRSPSTYTNSLMIKVLKATTELRSLREVVSRPIGQATTTLTIDNIPIGLTTFAATAHLTTDGTGAVVANGSADATISAGTTPVSISLTPLGLIAFTSDRDGNYEIYIMNEDGTGQTNLTSNPATDSKPAWSPDGTKIAFTSNRDGNNEIYVMNADGTGQMNLTNNPGSDHSPAWSPDGTKIAFASNRDGNAEIYVMNKNGTGQTRLTFNTADDWYPAWSPDGTKIAFHSNRDANYEIYVMNADGTGQTNLTNNPASDVYPAWSPDGSKIAFTSDRTVEIPDHESPPCRYVYVMNTDGTGQTWVNVGRRPTWSPDGTKIATDWFLSGLNNYEIYVMNADGTGRTQLTENIAYDVYDANPDWTAGFGSADVSVIVPNY